MSSDLHDVLPSLHPAHGKITQVSRLPPLTIRPIQTCFRFGYPRDGVNLASEE